MEGIVAAYFINLLLLQGITQIEIARRKKLLKKWVEGSLSLEELHSLKNQGWFQKAFTKVVLDKQKKEN